MRLQLNVSSNSWMSSLTEFVHFLSAPTNPQGLMDLSAVHVPSVLLSQVIFQNLKQVVLSKTLRSGNTFKSYSPQPVTDLILNYNTISKNSPMWRTLTSGIERV